MPQLTIPEVQAIQAAIAPLKSKRAKIMQAMKLILPSITKTNGYTQTVQEVGFDVKTWRDKTEDQCPVIYIVDDVTSITKHAGTVREYTWDIHLFGVCKGIDIMAFEEFLADIEQCLDDNNTLCGLVNKVEVEAITTDNQLFSELNDTGAHLFEVVVRVEYTRNARNPR